MNVGQNIFEISDFNDVYSTIKSSGKLEFHYQQKHRNRQHSRKGNLAWNVNILKQETWQEITEFQNRKPGKKLQHSRTGNLVWNNSILGQETWQETTAFQGDIPTPQWVKITHMEYSLCIFIVWLEKELSVNQENGHKNFSCLP